MPGSPAAAAAIVVSGQLGTFAVLSASIGPSHFNSAPPPQARVDDGVMVYKDLAALPRDKAILDIERPDLMTYELHYSYSPLEVAVSHPARLVAFECVALNLFFEFIFVAVGISL